MGKFIRILICLLVLLLFTGSFSGVISTLGANNREEIRVCLAKGTFNSVFRIVEGDYLLEDLGTFLPISSLTPGDTVTVNQEGRVLTININGREITGAFSGPITASPLNQEDLNVFSYKNTLYRDALSLSIDSGSILTINLVDLEHYLYGVVGQEMGYTASKEALKAQAVVSRTYALYGKSANAKFDVGIDTSSQVYGGYSCEQNIHGGKVVEAVESTQGRVIRYYQEKTSKGQLIQAVFHSNAGGFTENSENVWSETLPYLRAVPSLEDSYAETYAAASGESWATSTYRWEKTLTLGEIQEAIQNYSKKTGTPINIGDFQKINLYRVGRDGVTPNQSGRVTRMELVGNKGTYSVYRDNIRSVFALRSTLFDVEDKKVKGSTSEPPTSFAIRDSYGEVHKVTDLTGLIVVTGDGAVTTLNKTETQGSGAYQITGGAGVEKLSAIVSSLTFKGQGYGHGVGMSQWGARGMADKGYNYNEIIDHYYNQGRDDGRIRVERY